MNTSVMGELPRVEAALRYLEPMSDKPRSLEYERRRRTAHEASTGITRLPFRCSPVASALSLDREGFQLVTAASSVRDFYDEGAVQTRYYAETVSLLAELTGASRVVVFDHTIRRRIPGATDRNHRDSRQPVPRVHNDYT